jgi:Fe-S cluster assembly scaffold protein SufB
MKWRAHLDNVCQVIIPSNHHRTLYYSDLVHEGTIELVASKDASVTVIQEQHSNHNVHVHLKAQQGATITWFVLIKEESNLTYNLFLEGEQATIMVYMWYEMSNHQKLTLTTHHYHQAPNTTSRFLSKGVGADQASITWQGKVMVSPYAQGSVASQYHRALLLSKQVRVHAFPTLEIHTNQVRCNHGSAMGSFDPEHLFYLQARGLPQEHARQLLFAAFGSDIISLVPDDMVRKRWLVQGGIV